MNKELKYLKKLRIKYAGNEDAYDAIVYHMLTTTAPQGMDIPQKLKRAMEFYAAPPLIARQRELPTYTTTSK